MTNWQSNAENGFSSENRIQDIPSNGSVRFVAKAAFTAYWSRPGGSSEISEVWQNNGDFGAESRIPGPSTEFHYGPNEADNSYDLALGWQEQAESNSSELLTSSDEDGEQRGSGKNREFEDSISNAGSEIDTTAKTNVCFVCGKAYARPSTLKTHLRTHSGERPYKCLTCHKTFSQAANLTAHLRTHSGEKPFKCGICERRFSQSSSVTTHMRTHNGERPYRCRVCRKSFSDSSTLTKHMRVHSGEKPYHCNLCFAKFSQSGNLNRHLRVHMANGTYFATANCPR
ncbi:hypothetical protein Ciccas_007410 [Cichlidogyrus casuarinus]|uniref:C2H2-type domain-containing protein n=1 Tax=Cichlidogyrus casuarinus TaxID=1844966 RepID=A0ABD2Q2Z1_9PLAT